MKIIIDPQDPCPKYQQLILQIQRYIISGTLKPGEKLISVRKMASMLRLNPMTISRSYQNMEKEGWLTRKNGIGMIVAREGLNKRMEARFTHIEKTINTLIINAKNTGYSKSEIMALVLQNWDTHQ